MKNKVGNYLRIKRADFADLSGAGKLIVGKAIEYADAVIEKTEKQDGNQGSGS